MKKKTNSKVSKTARVPKKARIKKPKADKTGLYLGIEYESFCELSCIYFAEELIKLGYVDRIERCPSYLLCDPVHHTYAQQLKRGSKHVTQTISRGVSYTPDFDIYFTNKAVGVFCWDLGSSTKWETNWLVTQVQGDGTHRGCMEVKPDFSKNSTTPKSMQSMKWLMQKHGVYCNLFRPNAIFKLLFVPDKYLVTERGTRRVLNFTVYSLQQYLNKQDGKASKGVTVLKRSGKRQ